MLTSNDWARMASDLTTIRDDNPVSITIRRGSTTLAAQTVRIAQTGMMGRQTDSGPAQESRGGVVVMGASASSAAPLDIAPNDRFNAGGLLYRVVLVRPNQRAATVAEAEVVE
jgi:hypothetical protein